MFKFDPQLFGTNDTVTSGYNLYLGFEREDESIQYIKLTNFKDELTESQVKTAMATLTNNSILLDSKTSEPLSTTSIFTAYTEEKVTRSLDLS